MHVVLHVVGTHNMCFYGEISKIILYLSPNTHLICSTENTVVRDRVFQGQQTTKLAENACHSEHLQTNSQNMKNIPQTYPISIKSFDDCNGNFSWVVVKYSDDIAGDLRRKDITSDIHV